jgi:hypothetical protein
MPTLKVEIILSMIEEDLWNKVSGIALDTINQKVQRLTCHFSLLLYLPYWLTLFQFS